MIVFDDYYWLFPRNCKRHDMSINIWSIFPSLISMHTSCLLVMCINNDQYYNHQKHQRLCEIWSLIPSIIDHKKYHQKHQPSCEHATPPETCKNKRIINVIDKYSILGASIIIIPSVPLSVQCESIVINAGSISLVPGGMSRKSMLLTHGICRTDEADWTWT